MDWSLLFTSFGIWAFFGANFIFEGRIKEMAAAGLPIRVEGNPMLRASSLISQLAIFNQAGFLIAYGIYISWWQAFAIVLGGYAASMLYVLVTRGPVYDSLLNPTHKLGWVGMPVLSASLWLIAFYK